MTQDSLGPLVHALTGIQAAIEANNDLHQATAEQLDRIRIALERLASVGIVAFTEPNQTTPIKQPQQP